MGTARAFKRFSRPRPRLCANALADSFDCVRRLTRSENAVKILVLGAGAIGGYFGGRLLQSGQDVTFLVRPARRAELKQRGLVITSPRGNLTINDPPAILAEEARESADLILFACKAYDLESAIDSIHHAVGTSTAILPLLNGIKHLERLSEAFGRDRLLGGSVCHRDPARHTTHNCSNGRSSNIVLRRTDRSSQ